MTLEVTWLNGVCIPQYGLSEELVCEWRISWLDITDNGGTIDISSWSAFVKVVDSNWVEFMVKVYSDAVVNLPKTNWTDIIIKVPLANVHNGTINTDLSTIATIESVTAWTWANFHLILATIDWTGSISEVTNSWHYLPWCDICLRCVWGVLEIPWDVKINWDLEVTWDSSLQHVTTTSVTSSWNIQVTWNWKFEWDWSLITNINLWTLPNATETVAWIVELANQAEVNLWIDTTKAVTPETLRVWAIGKTIIKIWNSFTNTNYVIPTGVNNLPKGIIFHSTAAWDQLWTWFWDNNWLNYTIHSSLNWWLANWQVYQSGLWETITVNSVTTSDINLSVNAPNWNMVSFIMYIFY